MFNRFSTIILATLATVGAMTLSVQTASAGSIKISFGGHGTTATIGSTVIGASTDGPFT